METRQEKWIVAINQRILSVKTSHRNKCQDPHSARLVKIHPLENFTSVVHAMLDIERRTQLFSATIVRFSNMSMPP